MFKKYDASAEIANAMEKVIVSNAMDKKSHNLTKLATAVEYLNNAAEIFDDVGLHKEAEFATMLLESLAGKKKSKTKPKSKSKSKSKSRKSRKSDPATKGLSSEKMVSNLKEKGWVFNADDISYARDEEDDDYCSCNDNAYADDFDDDSYSYDINFEESDPEDDDLDRLMKAYEHSNHGERLQRLDLEGNDFEDERDTLPSTPVAKRHRREQTEANKPGGLADQMDDMGYDFDPRFP